tara:strand:+ start:1977 stop:2939 length:963 start_codon:yes stop_codon:yes gene_type:complete
MEINLVCGTNFYLIENFISEIKNNSEFEFERINSEFILKDEIWNYISTFSMFSEKKFIVIDSLLSKIASEEKEGTWEGFFGNVETNESSNIIYIIEKSENEKDLNSLLRKNIFKGVNFIKKEFNLPTGRGSFEKINNWVTTKEKEYGLNLSKNQRSIFIYDSNKDYILIESELLKLANFSKGNKIDESDFNKIVSISKNYKIFDLLDAFFSNNQKDLSLSISNLFYSGVTVIEITSMIASEIHKILLLKYLLNENKNNSEISKITGISSTFYFNKLLNTSKKIPMKRLKNIHNSLLEFDLKCKTMNFKKELELELLLLSN